MKIKLDDLPANIKALNKELYAAGPAKRPATDNGRWAAELLVARSSHTTGSSLTIVIPSQIRGGKNAITVTRTGARIPRPEWAAWRDSAVDCVRGQVPVDFKTITEPVSVELKYVAGDKRRRDQPAILDAIFHVLEKAGVVEDDTLLWVTSSTRAYDKSNPRAEIKLNL